jgi:hypothetical protein
MLQQSLTDDKTQPTRRATQFAFQRNRQSRRKPVIGIDVDLRWMNQRSADQLD